MTLLHHIFDIDFSQEKVMTGAVSASGRVHAVGEIVHKAARVEKAGKETLLLPVANAAVLEEWQGRTRKTRLDGQGVNPVPCATLWDVLKVAVVDRPIPLGECYDIPFALSPPAE